MSCKIIYRIRSYNKIKKECFFAYEMNVVEAINTFVHEVVLKKKGFIKIEEIQI